MIPITTPLPACKCGRQPKHWHDLANGGWHLLECSPCGNRTPRYRAFAQAVESWSRNDVRQVEAAPRKLAIAR